MVITLPDFDPIEYLVHRKYPIPSPLFVKYGGGSSHAPKKSNLDMLENLAGAAEKVDAYRQELAGKSAEDLALLVEEERKKQAEERKEAEELEEQRQYFNQPPATTVDYTHWAKMGTWTVNEAIALSMGRNPKQVNWELIKSKAQSPFVQAYSARQDLVLRGDLPWENVGGVARVKPKAFYNWLVKLELDFPEEMKKALIKFVGAVDWKYAYETLMEHSRKQSAKLQEVTEALVRVAEKEMKKPADKPFSTTEKNTLLKIVYAIAKDQYGYTHGVKGTAASDIEKAADAVGLKVDADTARKWLKQAGEYCKTLDAE